MVATSHPLLHTDLHCGVRVMTSNDDLLGLVVQESPEDVKRSQMPDPSMTLRPSDVDQGSLKTGIHDEKTAEYEPIYVCRLLPPASHN
jgi:hypothetical protein